MRRLDKEIADPEKIRQILKETSFVTLAMCSGNEPYLVSISHSYNVEENVIYFHCANKGKKLDILKINPRVWGQALIDHGYHEGQCSHLYVSAMFQGKVVFVEDLEEKRQVLKHMILHQDKNPEPLLKRLMSSGNDEALMKTVVGKILIGAITGKKSAEIEY